MEAQRWTLHPCGSIFSRQPATSERVDRLVLFGSHTKAVGRAVGHRNHPVEKAIEFLEGREPNVGYSIYCSLRDWQFTMHSPHVTHCPET
jgi:hypothetical protein